MKIRLSMGTAISLGLIKASQSVPPTTLYIMLGKNCVNNCAFCTQARESQAPEDRLSRVNWPEFQWDEFIGQVKESMMEREIKFKRACFQTLAYEGMVDELAQAVGELKKTGIPVSAAVKPLDKKELEILMMAGLDRIGIALDAASQPVFEDVKGMGAGNPFTWEEHLASLDMASQVFPGRTSTHLIIGMEEADQDVLDIMNWCLEREITVGLFAYTPFRGVKAGFSPPDVPRYRTIQALRYLLFDGDVGFGPDDVAVQGSRIVRINGLDRVGQEAFMTSGCAGCNRPFYNEKVSGPIYNYPRPLDDREYAESINLVRRYLGEL
ncbi:MAG: radical SAM protein [Thermoplasmata archaeon]|nr:radical SAM protein [Thermoplasmata archaeon]